MSKKIGNKGAAFRELLFQSAVNTAVKTIINWLLEKCIGFFRYILGASALTSWGVLLIGVKIDSFTKTISPDFEFQ